MIRIISQQAESDFSLQVSDTEMKALRSQMNPHFIFNSLNSISDYINIFIQVNDIIHCQSDVNYTNIYLKDKSKLFVAKTLKEYEVMLVDYNFYRVHNSHLINLSYIKSYNKG